jgi:uncharacterized protein
MLHLAGNNPAEQALEELAVYECEGVSGAIVENYHGRVEDVIATLDKIGKRATSIKVGINILPNEFELAFLLATCYNAHFIQLDHVAGKYTRGGMDVNKYLAARDYHPGIAVLGGVWPKYYSPLPGSVLESDLADGVRRADAIVVTGEGTGKATPLEKIVQFRKAIGTFPLIVGAGLSPGNAVQQLELADGAIVGSYFKKDGDTKNPIDAGRVKVLMHAVNGIKSYRH